MHAILSGHTKIVAYLLSLQEVDHTVPEKDGYTPMHAAGFQGRAEIVNLLLHSHRGISPSDRHYDGYTPMHRACWGRETRHFETVMAFIEQAGVPFDEKADDGRTCLDMTQNEQTREYLKKFKTKAREEAEKAKAEKIRREKELRSDL